MKGECTEGFRSRKFRISNSKKVLSKFEKRVWRRRQRSGKSSRIEEAIVRRKDDREFCSGI